MNLAMTGPRNLPRFSADWKEPGIILLFDLSLANYIQYAPVFSISLYITSLTVKFMSLFHLRLFCELYASYARDMWDFSAISLRVVSNVIIERESLSACGHTPRYTSRRTSKHSRI